MKYDIVKNSREDALLSAASSELQEDIQPWPGWVACPVLFFPGMTKKKGFCLGGKTRIPTEFGFQRLCCSRHGWKR